MVMMRIVEKKSVLSSDEKRRRNLSPRRTHALFNPRSPRFFSIHEAKKLEGGEEAKKVERRGGGGKTHFKTEHACKSLLRKRKREGSVE